MNKLIRRVSTSSIISRQALTGIIALFVVASSQYCKPRSPISKVRSADSETDVNMPFAQACRNFQAQLPRSINQFFYLQDPPIFIGIKEIEDCISEDLNQAGSFNSENFRYLDLTPYFNTRHEFPKDTFPMAKELETSALPPEVKRDISRIARMRAGISKLVNSMSWEKDITPVPGIDPTGTILRIDLRSYGWTEGDWNKIQEKNPYRGLYSTHGDKIMRGDVFLELAGTPPLYHEITRIPHNDIELEKKVFPNNELGDRVERNIQDGKVVRAGFVSSGVSVNNRLLERHEIPSGSYWNEIPSGSYWKSYDFSDASGDQNFFENPNGPCFRVVKPRQFQSKNLFFDCESLKLNGQLNPQKFVGNRVFRQAGGEVIWNLPNGLQGYMLLEGIGERIDVGPSAIVANRNDHANNLNVVNGMSCHYCHYAGIIDNRVDQVGSKIKSEFFTDAVRQFLPGEARPNTAFAEANQKAMNEGKLTKEFAEAVYPSEKKLSNVYKKDKDVFIAAEAKSFGNDINFVTVGTPDQEPIHYALRQHIQALSLARVAAELGLEPQQVMELLSGKTEGARILTSLKSGQTISRKQFSVVFPQLLKDARDRYPATGNSSTNSQQQ